MSVSVEYDLMDYVRDSNKKFSHLKLTKHLIKYYKPYTLYTAGLTIYGFVAMPIEQAIKYSLICVLGPTAIASMVFSAKRQDPVKCYTDHDLRDLSDSLREEKIDTDICQLRESVLTSKKYNFRLNENGYPQLVSTKYILVPSYGNKGQLDMEMIKQEHALFTKKYLLSRVPKTRKIDKVENVA